VTPDREQVQLPGTGWYETLSIEQVVPPEQTQREVCGMVDSEEMVAVPLETGANEVELSEC